MAEVKSIGTSDTVSVLLARNYRIAHGRVLEVIENLSEEQFRRPAHVSVHNIGWQVWHIARWDDRFSEILVETLPLLRQRHGKFQQLWVAESIGAHWGLPLGRMGTNDTGTGMEDEAAEALRLPARADVSDYARRVFSRLDEMMAVLPDETLLGVMAGDPDGDTAAQNVMYYLDHVNRHLGMIEAMKGQQGVKGSATR